jgi:exodeoxyribonuclease-3
MRRERIHKGAHRKGPLLASRHLGRRSEALVGPAERSRYGPAVKVATWNVNGIRARVDTVGEWLGRYQPDVLCMQETKVVDDDFPFEELTRLGYVVKVSGQAGYNGVAIASRKPISELSMGLYDDGPDAERRMLSATIDGVRILNVYVPNGKSVELPSFPEKLRWFERLRVTLDTRENPAQDLVLCGDFNVAREDRDVYDPIRLRGRLHFHPDEQRALERVLDFGLTDAFRALHAEGGRYSWWDYRGGDFRNNRGLRIDYAFVTRSVAERLERAEIDSEPRRLPKPSDHAPVLVEFG